MVKDLVDGLKRRRTLEEMGECVLIIYDQNNSFKYLDMINHCFVAREFRFRLEFDKQNKIPTKTRHLSHS